MPITRKGAFDIWVNHSASAGEETDIIDISKWNNILFYIEVSGATDITVRALIGGSWYDYDTITFAAADSQLWEKTSTPLFFIKFKTSNAVTVTIRGDYST